MLSHKPIPGQNLLPSSVMEMIRLIPTLETIELLPSPRVLKSHLPLYLLHPKLLDTSKVRYFLFFTIPFILALHKLI